MNSFLLIGQSNMAGRGFIDEAVPVDASHIYTLRNGRWMKMFRPINPDRKHAGVSLGERFAECFYNEFNADVGLICCADGGTHIDQWSPDGVLYQNALGNARLAMRSSLLSGILWHQGETDCFFERHRVYRQKLINMLTRLRKDLGNENIPIIIGGLGEYLERFEKDGWDKTVFPKINEALESAADALPHCAFVTAKGLESNPDNLHFNASSLYTFGERYYKKYREISKDIAIHDNETEQLSEIEKR